VFRVEVLLSVCTFVINAFARNAAEPRFVFMVFLLLFFHYFVIEEENREARAMDLWFEFAELPFKNRLITLRAPKTNV
jgi:hypothetical protein